MPKDDTQQTTVTSQTSTVSSGSTPPPVFPATSDTPPPMVHDLGSAAPTDDVKQPPVVDTVIPSTVINTNSPKKKFAGGKVIATMLGLFMLVGGVWAGIRLVGQNQNIEEFACGGPDYEQCRLNRGAQVCACSICGECTRTDTTPRPGATCAPGYNCPGDSGGGVPTTGGAQAECSDNDGVQDGFWCEGCGGFCLSGSYTGGGCSNAQQAMCGDPVIHCDDLTKIAYDKNGDGQINSDRSEVLAEGDGFYCPTEIADVIQPFSGHIIYLCSPAKYAQCGNRCDASCYGSIINSVPNNFCGIIQVDQTTNCTGISGSSPCSHISFYDNACENEPPADNPTPTPSAPPITAQCQNVKAYSENFTLLTSAQLADLDAGDKVNFCVAGVATGGSFDRARFTINNVLQAETTTVRPSSTDFCQLYTIPADTTTFNVSAQIHHVTLDWK